MANITEEEIQEALVMLKKTSPKKATRENAIKVVEKMKQLASVVVDRIDEDIESGKLKLNKN